MRKLPWVPRMFKSREARVAYIDREIADRRRRRSLTKRSAFWWLTLGYFLGGVTGAIVVLLLARVLG